MKLNTLTREETTRDVYVENLGKWIPEYKKYQKRQNSNEEEDEIIEFVEEEEDEEQQIEVVAPGGHLSSDVLSSEQNRIRENIAKNKLVGKGKLFHLKSDGH